MQSNPPDPTGSLLISYLVLRRAVGLIGMALPFVLALGKLLLEGPGLQSSLSSYYYTAMRDVFVGSLCAIAVFLWSYRGYDRRDDLTGNLAGLAAIGVALFPTTPDVGATERDRLIGALHLGSAAILFLCLAYFSLVLFRQSDQQQPTLEKHQRNQIYATCGYTILICIALIGLIALLPAALPLKQLTPIFWLESTAIIAFGISWFTKGETILKDKPSPS